MQFYREIIQPEFDDIRARMVTKDDLQAIRAEMATKVDLEAMRREMVTWPVLMRYHQEIVRPEVEEVRSKLADMATRDELLTHVDGIYLRLDQLTSEYHALSAAVRRLEDQMTQQKVDIGAVQSELVRINDQVSQLAQRVTKLENVLS
jgi:chromosome segregation ATPase